MSLLRGLGMSPPKCGKGVTGTVTNGEKLLCNNDHRIWGLQINGGDVFQWMTGLDRVNRQSCIGFEVRYEQYVGGRSRFAGILGVNRVNGRFEYIQEN